MSSLGDLSLLVLLEIVGVFFKGFLLKFLDSLHRSALWKLLTFRNQKLNSGVLGILKVGLEFVTLVQLTLFYLFLVLVPHVFYFYEVWNAFFLKLYATFD